MQCTVVIFTYVRRARTNTINHVATESNLYGYRLLPYTGTLPSLAGTGTAGDPFLINNHDDWLLFYWYVNSGTNSYSGQYVKLMADLTITTTVGLRDDKPFSGTFLGNGHTLTANLTGTILDLDEHNEQGTAPFHYIKNATIKDLTITGDTYATSLYAGGLVGFADGTNLIEGCIVTSTLHLSNRHAGGIIAHGLNSTTTLRNCVFAGTITSYRENQLYDGKNVIEIGGIWGWNDDEATPTLQNCLEKGSFNNIKSMHPIGLQGDKGTITNCYYVNQQIDSPTNACTVSGAYKVENSLSGLCKEITIEGVTVYSQSCTVSGVEANYVMTENPINVYPVMTDPSFGTTLNFDTDYTVTLDGVSVEALPISISTRGRHTLVFTGKGSYVGTKSVETYVINSINGTGSDTDPYIISNTDEWNTFAYYVNSGTNTYSGKYVKLTADISVTEMVSTSEDNSFQGTFLGDNVHTLTFTKGTSENAFNEQNCAPFRYVNGANIRDLKVAGNIYTSQKFAAGLVSRPYGTTSITNCHVNTVIHSSVNGDGTHGGIVAMPDGTLNIEGCAYTGRLLTNNGTTNCGGFVGWHNDETISVINSLYAPSGSITEGWSAINDGATFVRGGNSTINNSYYTEALGTEQGKIVYTTTTTAPANLGSLKEEYSMLTAYANGILFEGTYYMGRALNGAGTEGNPYIIATDDDWETFVYNVNNGFNNYNGKFVRLDESISVSTMVGTSDDRSFQGTFLGNNNTLTFTQGSSESAFGEEYCAPFRYVKNATIQDLKVAGDIYTSRKFAAGLIAQPSGTTYITDCLIGTVIHSSVNGDGTHGGIVARLSSNTTEMNITGCVFNGRLLTNNGTHSCAGFVGWWDNKSANFSNSLYAPDANITPGAGETAITNGATFIRDNYTTLDNCYYTETLSTAQGLPGNVRTITGYGSDNDKWAFIASPLLANDINPTTIEELIGSGTAGDYNYDLFRLNIEYERWENYMQHTDDFVIANGTGYLYAKQSDVTLTFTGTYNIDNTKEVNLQQGFNLVGNPFPRAAWADRSYYKMNSTGTDIEVVENYAENRIEPCYGIVVRAENANESIMFRTSAPQQQASANNGNLQMTLTKAGVRGDSYQDKAIVSFNEGSELEKFIFNENHAKLYIPQYGEDYAIASSETTGEVPLNFKTKETGRYTIGFNFENVKGVRIQLIDKIEDRITDLKAIDSYTFMGSSADRDDRFTLVFTQVEVGGIFAYQSGNDIIVSGEGELQVFDVMGRMVMNQYINGVQTVEKPEQTGVYIFRLNGKTQKMVVR